MTKRTTRRRALCATCEVCELKFEDIFARMGQDILQESFLGKISVELLEARDPDILKSAKRLQEATLKLISPYEILTNKKTRKCVLSALRKKDAEDLAKTLNLRFQDSPYPQLEKLRVSKGSEIEKALLEFFGVAVPMTECLQIRPNNETVIPDIEMFNHQRLVVRDATEKLRTNPHRVLIHMPTGAGKTRIAMRIITDHLLKHEPTLVVWLAYSEELCEQAIEEFSKNWKSLGNRVVKVHRFFGKYAMRITEQIPHDGVLVASLSKMYNADTKAGNDVFLSALADKTTLVVMDEAHQAIADTYNYVLEQLVEKHEGCLLLGLTATPGRTWNDPAIDKKLANFFSHKKVTLNKSNPIKFLVQKGYLANTKIESLDYNKIQYTVKEQHDIVNSLDIPKHILEKLAKDVQRSLIILYKIRELINSGHKRIIVFASTVEHAKALALSLKTRNVNAQCITSETPSDIRRLEILKYKENSNAPMVLCNFGVLTTGFDAPMTSAAVIARPTKSLVLYSQMAGRAMRGPKAGGMKEARIISVVDSNLPGFNDFSKAFLNWEDVW